MWLFDIKRFPGGNLRNIKAIICVRVNTQVSWRDYFYTHEPVVKWSTIYIIIVLSKVLYMNTKHSYYTNAFTQSPLKDDGEVYI